MAEAAPAVALLFDDAGLGEQLRTALLERGARIVHEGPLAGISHELLSSVDADVMVVNLEDDDEALDRLDQCLVGDRPRVVFNEGQASRRLEGWDRARWARHLAMKVLAMGDADPPRPPAPAEIDPTLATSAATMGGAPEPQIDPSSADAATLVVDEEARQAAVSETLAAELEALLASDVPMEEADEFGSGLNYAADEGHVLHDGAFGHEPAASTAGEEPDVALVDSPAFAGTIEALAGAEQPIAVDAVSSEPSLEIDAMADEAFETDPLQLAMVSDEIAAVSDRATVADAAKAPRLSDSWTLFDHDTPASESVDRADPADFGIQKLSAADYLAPDAGDQDESPVLPGLSLELVSIEDAIAPQHFEASHEMVLDLPQSVLRRVVVLGATTESTASVGDFLAALPVGLRATVLHTQHLAGRPAEGLVEYFASRCPLPVRLAEPGLRARVGEVIVVPSDRQVGLRRDGTLELQQIEPGSTHAPSIDVSFTQAASVFGRDVFAIVFAGRSTDAVAGCQAVHDRGGQVWVESIGGVQSADMVSGVQAERLSHFAGMPAELAARLAEQIPEGQP